MSEETGWLVEGEIIGTEVGSGARFYSPCWYKADGTWTKDSLEAVRFAKKSDADFKIKELCKDLPAGSNGDLFSIEHMWLDD